MKKEKYICKPLTNYAKAKYKASSYLLKLYKEKNFPVLVLRLYQAYGPKQDLNRLIPITIVKSLNDEEINLSPGNQIRDFIFIDDLTEIILKFIKTKLSKQRVFNIGTNNPIKIKDLIKKIIKMTGKGKPNFGKIKIRKGEIMNMYPNNKSMQKKLKWKPKISLSKGLKLTINSYKLQKKF